MNTESGIEPVSHWDDYGVSWPDFSCKKATEFCRNCGRQLVEHVEVGMFRSERTGGPTYVKYHSCPTWIEGWRAKPWARVWALPGNGHESHDAENPLSARDYR